MLWTYINIVDNNSTMEEIDAFHDEINTQSITLDKIIIMFKG